MKSKQLSVLFLFLCFTVFGQQKITVEKIYMGGFRAQGMDELQSMKNTNQYTVLNQDQKGGQQIDLFDFATLKRPLPYLILRILKLFQVRFPVIHSMQLKN